MIPSLTSEGLLPPGVHFTSWEELERRFGQSTWRRRLISGLRRAAMSLAAAGCKTLYIDGSFVTDKLTPGDFDACWDEQGVDPNLLDPVLLTFDANRAAQKAKYGGEFFPAAFQARHRAPFRLFLDFFQQDKNGRPKGIVAIDLTQHKP